MPVQNQTCVLCRGAAESCTSDRRLALCRRCIRDKVLPLVVDALGATEAVAAINNLVTVSATPGASPIASKLERLISGGVHLSRAEVLAGRGVSAGEVSLARRAHAAREAARLERRPMTRQETQLSLAAVAAVQRRLTRERTRSGDSDKRVAARAAAAMVRKLDLDRGRR
jgi:hypothetical protein